MSIEAIITIIASGLVSIIGSAIVVSVAWRKAPTEMENTDADTAGKYQAIADKEAEKRLVMQGRLDGLQGRINAQDIEIAAMKRQAYEREATISTMQNTQAEHRALLADKDSKIRVLSEEMSELKGQMDERDRLIDEWQHGITRLLHQLESINMTPVWQPQVRPARAKR